MKDNSNRGIPCHLIGQKSVAWWPWDNQDLYIPETVKSKYGEKEMGMWLALEQRICLMFRLIGQQSKAWWPWDVMTFASLGMSVIKPELCLSDDHPQIEKQKMIDIFWVRTPKVETLLAWMGYVYQRSRPCWLLNGKQYSISNFRAIGCNDIPTLGNPWNLGGSFVVQKVFITSHIPVFLELNAWSLLRLNHVKLSDECVGDHMIIVNRWIDTC